MGVRRGRQVRRAEPLTAGGIVAINLRKARELRGLSQAEAGELLGEYLRRPWSAATVSAAERSWEVEPARSFAVNEVDGFSRAFRLPLLWFLLPPGREESGGRPLPERWVRRLLWAGSRELVDRAETLATDRRVAALLGLMRTAEDALARALEDHSADRLRGLARQLRDIAGALEAAGRKRGRRSRGADQLRK